MEVGAHVWLRKEDSHWGWVPAVVTKKEPVIIRGIELINLTMKDDPNIEVTMPEGNGGRGQMEMMHRAGSIYFGDEDPFEVTVTVDPEQLKTADHDDIKLRNLPTSFHLAGEDPEAGVLTSPGTHSSASIVGGVDDLIELTHLHEPAILHALRLRYDSDIIYTSTGPILIAVNPFKKMNIYSSAIMMKYCLQGENVIQNTTNSLYATPFKSRSNRIAGGEQQKARRLEPHVYQTADDAYRAMLRGMENFELMRNPRQRPSQVAALHRSAPTNQSILVSGESGAGKTVTTKIVLNYFAMLSKRRAEQGSPSSPHLQEFSDVSIEQQVLQSNPILESFGNARTIRNDNSSRFGKFIDIRFTRSGKLTGASIETYLLEKVRLIHPGQSERNYHVFYQFLSSASAQERRDLMLGSKHYKDFRLLSQSGTFDRRDGVSDVETHKEMLDAMAMIGFPAETTAALMRLVVGVLFAGNMTFTASRDGESCRLNDTDDARTCAALFGISFEGLAAALTARVILAGEEIVHKPLTIESSMKACEALIKAVYGAAFDFIVERVNQSITNTNDSSGTQVASIGLLDIFGFETFEVNSFEQICINYTNEALQQQFNRYVFKLEQQEYEREGIMWKFISFPDNQDVLDLIDKKHTGIMALLDEQCILPKSTDEKFTRYLYARCDKHPRFSATSSQRVDYLFSIEHYAGYVEYTTDGWLEKNKDQLPAASADLLKSSTFSLIQNIQQFVRSEDRGGRGTVATKSVSSQFSSQLKTLRSRIDETVPHYVRCLKPNDELTANYFEPKNVVEQLRCGGVLEAVRVSRAGYPTRYPHEVFLARYYILGDHKDKTLLSPAFGGSDTSSVATLKRLISDVAFDLWYLDHQMIKAIVIAEQEGRDPFGSPKYLRRLGKPGQNHRKVKLQTGPYAPPINLVVESSVQTPEEQRKKRQKDPSIALRERRQGEKHNVARPECEEEFLALDFASRCAVAGLQLGRTKVFLRREAFDRIEAMRSDKFFSSASVIQAHVRGKACRKKFIQMRAASIKIQSIMRMKSAMNELEFLRVVSMVIKIQNAWRFYHAGKVMNELLLARRFATTLIQRAYRRYRLSLLGPNEDEILNAVSRFQALYRGYSTRKQLDEGRRELERLERLERERLERSRLRDEERKREEALAKKKIDPPMVRSTPPKVMIVEEPVRVKEEPPEQVTALALVQPNELVADGSLLQDLFNEIHSENWAVVEGILDKNPELAEVPDPKTGELALHKISRHSGAWTLLIDMVLVLYPKALIHRDNMGALPIHHAAAHDNLQALEIIYSAYKEGINETDKMGRLPIHVAANYDAVDSIKFLLSKSPEGAYTMVYRPSAESGGGLPLHIACANNASIGIITALLAENFASAKKADENGDLPLHLLLRCGEVVDPVVVKTLLTCFSGALSRTDSSGDLPLSIALKYECRSAVINAILMQYPEAAGVLNGDHQSPLFLAFQHNADDRTIMGLLNHAPELATAVDRKTGLLPIQVATENEHSHFIVHNLLKRDLPIDTKEKVRAQLIPHHYSWNHIVSNTEDMYHQVITKVLQSCTQPQVLALAHVEGPDGRIALASATPVCKHEMRVMLRLFNTLEVVNQRPAYTNPISDTQIFYALRYDAPPQHNASYTVLHEEKKDGGDNDYLEDFDDHSHVSGLSRNSVRSHLTTRSQQTIDDKLRHIRNEKGQQVIAKLTSRSDVVERELKIRKDYHLSRHYVPAIISVHHTVQHAAYSEAMAEPGYCITMEGADTTAENLMLDMRKSGKRFPAKALKRIGISLLHMHEHGIIHGDFGTHNIGKFGSRWKLLGVGGSIPIGGSTDPDRGFYHPPEAIYIENKRVPIGKKQGTASVVSIQADPTYDIWAYGVIVYESIAGVPLGPYACRGKRAMTQTEIYKIGTWDEHSVRKALKVITEDDAARDLLKRLLHHDPDERLNSMRKVLEHPFFTGADLPKSRDSGVDSTTSPNTISSSPSGNSKSSANFNRKPSGQNSVSNTRNYGKSSSNHPSLKAASSMESIENRENNVRKADRMNPLEAPPSPTGSVRSVRSFGGGFRKLRSSLRQVRDR